MSVVDDTMLRQEIALTALQVERRTRQIECRDGLLYEGRGQTPLRITSNTNGLYVGCTFLTWPAVEELEKRLRKMRGEK